MTFLLKTIGVAALVGAGTIAIAQTTNSTNGSNPSSIGGLPVTGTTPGSAGLDRTMSNNRDPNPSNAMSSSSTDQTASPAKKHKKSKRSRR